MINFYNRLLTAFSVMFKDRVIVLEVDYDEKTRLDRIGLWASVDMDHKLVNTLRTMANSIEADLKKKDRNHFVHNINQ